MTAGNTGIAPGTANANGKITSEFRVAELNATARPAGASNPASLASTQPTHGAIAANAAYTGNTLNAACVAAPSCGTTAATMINSTAAVAGTGRPLKPSATRAPISFLAAHR